MASAVFSPKAAKGHIDEDGFFDIKDATVGEDVWQMECKGFPLTSEYGLDFCKERVLGDEVSTPKPCHGLYVTPYSVSEKRLKAYLGGARWRTG